MIEITGNLWDVECAARCITTNGFVKRNGAAVMGRGCAREARDRIPGLDLRLGNAITKAGNHVHRFAMPDDEPYLFSFPVKHHWKERADVALIERSAQELVAMVNVLGDTHHFYPGPEYPVVIPRPGCGNGQLNWVDVKPILEDHLDDRFAIITF